MLEEFLIVPYVGKCPINPNQINEYVHKSFSAFSNVTNIDTSISYMGIRTSVNSSGGFTVILPKIKPSVEMTVAHYRTHVKPILENALNTVCNKYEREFVDLQDRICMDVMKAQMDYSVSQNYDYYYFMYNRLKLEYQTFARNHYHYLYRLAVLDYKDIGEYIAFHIVVFSFPSIPY